MPEAPGSHLATIVRRPRVKREREPRAGETGGTSWPEPLGAAGPEIHAVHVLFICFNSQLLFCLSLFGMLSLSTEKKNPGWNISSPPGLRAEHRKCARRTVRGQAGARVFNHCFALVKTQRHLYYHYPHFTEERPRCGKVRGTSLQSASVKW